MYKSHITRPVNSLTSGLKEGLEMFISDFITARRELVLDCSPILTRLWLFQIFSTIVYEMLPSVTQFIFSNLAFIDIGYGLQADHKVFNSGEIQIWDSFLYSKQFKNGLYSIQKKA